MKKLFIAGNWKSNKTISQAKDWFDRFVQHCQDLQEYCKDTTVVICAPFTTLPALHEKISAANIALGLAAQNVSKFSEGAFTGETTGAMIKEVAEWVIIGHSERRNIFNESETDVTAKIEKAHDAGLKIIYCVPGNETPVPPHVDIVAYEPVWAIGTGKADTPENANSVIMTIKERTGAKTVIYGGSVTPDNVASFVKQQSIDGVLPGGASLDPDKFAQLIQAAVTAVRN